MSVTRRAIVKGIAALFAALVAVPLLPGPAPAPSPANRVLAATVGSVISGSLYTGDEMLSMACRKLAPALNRAFAQAPSIWDELQARKARST